MLGHFNFFKNAVIQISNSPVCTTYNTTCRETKCLQILSSIFQTLTPPPYSTDNYLVNNFTGYIDVTKLKLHWEDFELFNFMH